MFITMGEEGVLAADGRRMIHAPCCPARMRNATGAGDAFMAALVWAWQEGLDLGETCRAAAAAAAVAVESEETINPELSPETLRNRMARQARPESPGKRKGAGASEPRGAPGNRKSRAEKRGGNEGLRVSYPCSPWA